MSDQTGLGAGIASSRDLSGYQSQLKKDGWCVVPDVLDDAMTELALERLWRAARVSEKSGVPTHMPILDPNASNVRVFYLLERDEAFRNLIQHPTAVEMVRSLLGESYMISNFTANIARPGSKSMALHSDQSLVVPQPWIQPWSMNIIWCLTDVTFENGATLFIPGSHKWQNRKDVPEDANKRLKPFEAKAGSLLVMDGRLWHTSGANITEDEDRALLFGYYSVPFLRPQVNWNAALSPATQETLSLEMRQRLGLEIEANTGVELDLRYLEDQFAEQEAAL